MNKKEQVSHIIPDAGKWKIVAGSAEDLCKTLQDLCIQKTTYMEHPSLKETKDFLKIQKSLLNDLSFAFKNKDIRKDIFVDKLMDFYARFLDREGTEGLQKKVLFTLEKLGVDKKLLWKKIYEHKEKNGTYIVNDIMEEYENILDMWMKMLAGKPSKKDVINVMNFYEKNITLVRITYSLSPVVQEYLFDFVDRMFGEGALYLYKNKPTSEDWKYIEKYRPGLVN